MLIQKIKIFICTGLLLAITAGAFAQRTIVSGKVTDRDTGDGMPFVNIFFQGTSIGTTSDFEGRFSLATDTPSDSLVASYIGYVTKTKAIAKGKEQQVLFQMEAQATALQGVDIVYGEYENPAWEIMREVMKHKRTNDKRALDAYQYESYSKVELDVDNISEKFKEKKMVQKLLSVMDSIQHIAGEDGKPILPIFVSETISDYYFINNPARGKEVIKKTKLTGIALENGSLTSQVIGSSFQIYNFYENWLKLNDKDFISPIADSWRAFYDYELALEKEMIDGYSCFRIQFTPKRPEDLAFNGTMWIVDSVFALKQIDLRIGREANLNFIEKVQVQQELQPAYPGGPWLPSKSRILIDIGEIKDNWAGMLAKFYVSTKNITINQPKEASFYQEPVTVEADAMRTTEAYWAEHRHDSLSATEQYVYQMIDTMRNLPAIRTYVEIADIAFNGYKSVGKFDLGPYIYAFNYNDVEGARFQLGFRSNYLLSKKFIFKGYGAYGTKDQHFKYNAEIQYIADRKHWTLMGVKRYSDIDRMGIVADNWDWGNNTLFIASSRAGILRRPFRHEISELSVQTDVVKGWTQRIALRNRQFNPIEKDYQFYYKHPADGTALRRDFTITELILETRLSFKEKWLQFDNERMSLGTDGRPIVTLKAVLGINNLFNSDFNYQKFDVRLDQNIRLGLFGRMNYSLSGGWVPSRVPYPLLETHLGNQSFFYNTMSFNLMNFFEFVSDHYAILRVNHSFEGLILNRIPLMRKLKWRSFVTANALMGGVRQENIDLIPKEDADGNPILPYPAFNSLEKNKPYLEVGYGVENIFRFLRVDFIHRLTYLNRGASPFGVKVSTQFKF